MNEQEESHSHVGAPRKQAKPPINLGNEAKLEHPPLHYSVNQLYMIKKESFLHSNDLIVKRLQKCIQRIKRYTAASRQKELLREYDSEVSTIRRDFRRAHDLYKAGSKTQQITMRKIEKMKARIEKAKNQVSNDEMISAKDIDLSRLYIKSTANQSMQKLINSNSQKEKPQ